MTTPVIAAHWDIVEKFVGGGLTIKLELHRQSQKGMLQVGHCFFKVTAIGLDKMGTGTHYGKAEIRLDGETVSEVARWFPYEKAIEIDFGNATRAFEVDKRFGSTPPFGAMGEPPRMGKARFHGG